MLPTAVEARRAERECEYDACRRQDVCRRCRHPRTWDDAADWCLERVALGGVRFGSQYVAMTEAAGASPEQFRAGLHALLNKILDRTISGQSGRTPEADMWAVAIAAHLVMCDAPFGMSPEQEALLTGDNVHKVLVERHAKYGPSNLLRHGVDGIRVRLADKQARLANLSRRGDQFADDTLVDTIIDIYGYAICGVMIERGWFELPLQRDLLSETDNELGPFTAAEVAELCALFQSDQALTDLTGGEA